MKVLNLYAGIGGNRKLWDDSLEVTAVEYNPQIAAVYQDLYPSDTVIVADAHEYLKDNFEQFDIIWTSPPCQTHSSFRKNICCEFRGTKPEYPDMRLYAEILFLQNYFNGIFVVENVKPFYNPLIKEDKELHRHLFWSNAKLRDSIFETAMLREAQIPDLQEYHGVNLDGYDLVGVDKRQVLRNMVNSKLGEHIMNCMLDKDVLLHGQQGSLF